MPTSGLSMFLYITACVSCVLLLVEADELKPSRAFIRVAETKIKACGSCRLTAKSVMLNLDYNIISSDCKMQIQSLIEAYVDEFFLITLQ